MNKWNMLVVNEKLSQSVCLAPTPEKIEEYELYKKYFNELYEEIERLNNIINELEGILEYEKNDYGGNIDIETHNIDSEFLRGNSWEADYILNKLQELKGDGSND